MIAVQASADQCRTPLCSSVQCSAVQCSAMQLNAAEYLSHGLIQALPGTLWSPSVDLCDSMPGLNEEFCLMYQHSGNQIHRTEERSPLQLHTTVRTSSTSVKSASLWPMCAMGGLMENCQTQGSVREQCWWDQRGCLVALLAALKLISQDVETRPCGLLTPQSHSRQQKL